MMYLKMGFKVREGSIIHVMMIFHLEVEERNLRMMKMKGHLEEGLDEKIA